MFVFLYFRMVRSLSAPIRGEYIVDSSRASHACDVTVRKDISDMNPPRQIMNVILEGVCRLDEKVADMTALHFPYG
jgi:hypothetical protein